METVLMLVLIAFALVALVALPFVFHHRHVGSPTTRQRRQADMLRALDGRPEVRVPATGTGLAMDQAVWLARQHGYDLARVEGYGMQPRYLVLRLTGPFVPPAAPGAVRPTASDLEAVRRDVRRSANPGGLGRLAFLAVLLGLAAGWKAVAAYRAEEAFAVPGALSLLLLAGAAVLCVMSRAVLRRGGGGNQ